VRWVRDRTLERGTRGAAALVVLLAAATLTAAVPSAVARASSPEAALRAYETKLLGPAHAAEHAARRGAQRRRARRRPTRRRALRARAASAPADQVGAWYEPGPGATPFALPDYAIHAALLPTGKVMLWGYPPISGGTRPNTGNAWLWDPALGFAANAFRRVAPPADTPIYCSGETLLANGNLFIAGGNLDLPANKGLNVTFTFDPFNETWHQQGNLGHGRWYPGQVQLPDGRVAILGGYTENGSTENNSQLEIWPRRDLPAPDDAGRDAEGVPAEHVAGGDRATALYPHLFLTPAGKLLLAGPGGGDSALLDLGGASWSDLGHLPGDVDRIGGNAMLTPGGDSVMQVGGYDYATYNTPPSFRALATATTAAIATDGSTGWTAGASQSVGRAYGNTVLLPDGTMASVGGSAGRDKNNDGTYWTNGDDPALKTVELYDPSTGWRVGPAQQQFRTYHSIALLLPDGSVLSAGDDLHEDQVRPDDTWIGNAEIYRPPYFFKGARPAIASAPGTVHWGQSFDVGSPDEPRIDHAVLMAPSATTHGADMTQRQVPLAVIARTGGGAVTLAGPASAYVAPPGYYMLFLLDSQGVPSVARWIRVGPAPAGSPETPPGGGAATTTTTSMPAQAPAPAIPKPVWPRMTGLSISPPAFAAAARGGGAARRTGATVGFRLSAAARVTFKVERSAAGRRRNRRCEAPSRSNRGRPRCRRWALLRGRLNRAGVAGRNSLRFDGWLGGRALAPGSYRLVVATVGGGTSRTAFRIVR
jgi:hypothetical protein